jgi:FeS assembly SUF system regulator
MIKLSRLADYGIVILCDMASAQADSQELLHSARRLSERTMLNEPTIMKILKLLVKADIVSSVRGPKGGYRLNRPIRTISILDVVNAIDGQVALTLCSEAHGTEHCAHQEHCNLRHGWSRVNVALKETLERFSLADFLPQASAEPMTFPAQLVNEG